MPHNRFFRLGLYSSTPVFFTVSPAIMIGLIGKFLMKLGNLTEVSAVECRDHRTSKRFPLQRKYRVLHNRHLEKVPMHHITGLYGALNENGRRPSGIRL